MGVIFSRALFVAALLNASVGSFALADAPVERVKAPCLPSAEEGGFLRKCSEVIQGVPGVSGYTGGTGILGQVTAQMRRQIDDPSHSLYRGEIVDPSSPNPHSPDSDQFGTPTCDLVPGPFNGGKPESETNHLGQSCGNPALFEVRVSRRSVNTLMYMSGSSGTLEASYLRGVWIQVLTCYTEQVKRELELTRELKVSPSCRSMAGAFAKMGTSAQGTVTRINSALRDQANIADIWKCDAKATSTDDPGYDVGRHRQSAQQLCSGRSSMETLFTQIAMCEIFDRSGRAYRGAIKEPAAFLQEIKDVVADNCKRSCAGKCGSCDSPGGCSSCGTDCVNSCYTPELRRFILEKMKPWPSDGGCRL